MSKKIAFYAYWQDFNYTDNFLIDNFFKKYDNVEITEDILNADIVMIGSFVNSQMLSLLYRVKGIKILYVTEPIGHFFANTLDLLKNNYFDYVFGCVRDKDYVKFPIYTTEKSLEYFHIFNKINDELNEQSIHDKKFACLINRCDKGHTRTNIHNALSTIGKIDCPSKLFNNCSPNELNSIGNPTFINKYKFNICPENFKCPVPGYITEKLMNCCLGSAIPVYSGDFDEIDGKIFNKNRIIFYDPYDTKSMDNAMFFVKRLCSDKELLEKYYKQPIFVETAFDTMKDMYNNVSAMFDRLIL